MLKYLHKKNTKRKEAHFANTECKDHQIELQGLEIGKSRKTIVKNDGKVNSSDWNSVISWMKNLKTGTAKSPGMPWELKSFSVNCFWTVSGSRRKP